MKIQLEYKWWEERIILKKSLRVIFISIICMVLLFMVYYGNKEYEKQRLVTIKAEMKKYEYNTGRIGIAVEQVKTSKSVNHTFGKPIYPDDKNLQYIWVYLNVINSGTDVVHVTSDAFALSIPGGHGVNYDSKATYSFRNRFEPITLNPEEHNRGWLIFALPESSEYILQFNGINSKVDKRIIQ